MSVFADAYSRYLSNHFNYVNKSKLFRKYFRNSIISLTDSNFMSKILVDKIGEFPKYPYFLNVIARTDSFNLVKIYNTSMDNMDTLAETMVGCVELQKKESYDTIPSSLDQFLAEVSFQFSYISTPTDLYNYDFIVKSFISEYQYENRFSDLYTPLFYSTDQSEGETAGLEDKSFLYQYMLYSCLYNVFGVSHNIYSQLLQYMTYINTYGAAVDKVDKASMLTGFQIFAGNYNISMSVDLASVIGKAIYNFQNISPVMRQDLVTIINDKITNVTSGLNASFYNFFNPLNSLAPINFITNNVVRHLNALVTADVVSKIYDDNTIISSDLTDAQTDFEDEEYTLYMGKITEYQLKNYLFLCFLYKFWPIKFLNVLQLSMKEYVENIIKTSADDMLTKDEFETKFSYLCSNIDYTNLETFLNSYLCPASEIITYGGGTHATYTFTTGTNDIICTDLDSYNAVNVHDYIYANGDLKKCAGHVVLKIPATLTLVIDNEYTGVIETADIDAYKYEFTASDYLYSISESCDVPEFAAINYYLFLLDEFFKSTYYTTFIEELTEEIFIYLRDSGHVAYDFNWYQYHDVIRVYFKVYLRHKLLDQSVRCLLPDYTNTKLKFEYNSSVVYCSNLDSYNAIVDNSYIFSGSDIIDSSRQVISHSIVGSDYMLNLAAPYPGTTSELFSTAYSFKTVDDVLFGNVTENFVNKLYPRVLSNITVDPQFDINVKIPNETDLKNLLSSFSSSQSFIKSMHQFSENLVLSTLTREVIYSVLSDFV